MEMEYSRMEQILDNFLKFNKAICKARKNIKAFEKTSKEQGWLIYEGKEFDAKVEKMEQLLKKMGFVEENELKRNYWYYHKGADKTINVVIGTWFNDYYRAMSGQLSVYKMKGKQEFHTIRNGEYFYEDGQLKLMTSRGVYTGD